MVTHDSEAAWELSPRQASHRRRNASNYRTLFRHVASFVILATVLVVVASGASTGGRLSQDPSADATTTTPSSYRHRFKRSSAAATQQQQEKSTKQLISKYANLTYAEAIDIESHERLFVIGDVHGCLDELNKLVDKIGYNYANGDRLIFLGDLTFKGPKSLDVIRRARELNAWCVRGNHDDKIIRVATFLRSRDDDGVEVEDEEQVFPEGLVHDPIKRKNKHIPLASQLAEDDPSYAYLAGCPMMLTIPSLQSIFVHAGLDPSKTLDEQDPYYVMNMRTLQEDGSPAKHRKDGIRSWAKAWNEVQVQKKVKAGSTKVYYGHAAASKLQLKEYTFGLDTGCVYGGELTALEIHSGRISQVQCPTYAEHD